VVEARDKTFVGIDYGTRRIGLAKSDPTGLIASPLTTIEITSDREAVEKLANIIHQYQPAGLVIGYPLSLSGDRGPKCREVDRFIEQLGKVYPGPIHKVDERLSSVEAARVIHAHGKKVGTEKRILDRVAAVIILQRFLDERPLKGTQR